VAVGHVSACVTHWWNLGGETPLIPGGSRGFGAVRRPSGPTGARNQQVYFTNKGAVLSKSSFNNSNYNTNY